MLVVGRLVSLLSDVFREIEEEVQGKDWLCAQLLVHCTKKVLKIGPLVVQELVQVEEAVMLLPQ